MMELFRIIGAASDEKGNPSFRVMFPHDSEEFRVIKRHYAGGGSPVVASGEINRNGGLIEVSYSGLVGTDLYPSCHLERIQNRVQHHFTG